MIIFVRFGLNIFVCSLRPDIIVGREWLLVGVFPTSSLCTAGFSCRILLLRHVRLEHMEKNQSQRKEEKEWKENDGSEADRQDRKLGACDAALSPHTLACVSIIMQGKCPISRKT